MFLFRELCTLNVLLIKCNMINIYNLVTSQYFKLNIMQCMFYLCKLRYSNDMQYNTLCLFMLDIFVRHEIYLGSLRYRFIH